jgi:O-antigen/teichoic acid export membrane protein
MIWKLNKKKIGLLTVGVSRVLNNGVNFLITFILVRFAKISSEENGTMLYVLSLISIISLVTDFGMTEGLQKYVNNIDPKKIIGPAIFLEIGIVTLTGIFIAFFDKQGILTGGSNALFAIAIIMSVYNIIILVFNGLHQQLKSSIYQIFYVASSLSFLSLARFQFQMSGIDSALFGISAGWFVVNCLMIWDLYKQKLLSFHLFLPKEFIVFCLNNFIYILFYTILTQSDALFVRFNLGLEANSIYRSTVQIALFTRILGITVATPLLPIFSKKIHENKILEAKKILIIGCGLIFTILSFVFLFSLFFSQWFLYFVFQNSLIALEGKNIFPILILGFGIQSINLPLIYFLQSLGKEKLVRNVAIIQAIFYLGAMFIFYYKNIYWPAYTLLAVELFISLPVYWYNLIKKTDLNPNQSRLLIEK